MIEGLVIGWLNSRGYGFEAFGDVPNPRPERFMTVERTGGAGDGRFLDRAQVAVQFWGPSRAGAASMADMVDRDIRANIADGAVITACRRNSLSNHPSGDGLPRYQAVYDITALG